MTLSVTGHRPDKLGGYGDEIFYKLALFARDQLVRLKPVLVITGMALGWDTAVALACADLELPFVAAIPFPGQDSRWPADSRRRYGYLLDRAARTHIVCAHGEPIAASMQKRNEWMVDNSDKLLALYNGSYGGTRNCLKYAEKLHKEVIYVWEEWLEVA